MRRRRARVFSCVATSVLVLLTATTAFANPPDGPGGRGGPYRQPGQPVRPPQPPLTAEQQARINRIVQRETANYQNFESRLQAGIDRVRAERGLRPLNRNPSHCIPPGTDEEELARSGISRGLRIRTRIREVAERWVREHPGNSTWDRFVRWWRGDDNDGPPSSGGGGNLATDFGLEDIDRHGTEQERAGSAGLRGHQRDGVVGEDPADPDMLPSGPHILILPAPGTSLPSLPMPEAIPFRLPVFEPLLIRNEHRNPENQRSSDSCSCSSTTARTAAVNGGTQTPSLNRNPLFHTASAASPIDIDDSGSESNPQTPTPTPGPTGTPDENSAPPSNVTGDFGDIAWSRFRLQRSDSRWQNCYRIEANTTHNGQLQRLNGFAKISSTDRGASWDLRYWAEVNAEKELRDPLSRGAKMTISAAASYSATFPGRNRSTLRDTDRQLSGLISLINPGQDPALQTIPLNNSFIPEVPGARTQIETNATNFEITITAPELPTLVATIPKHRTG